MPLCNCCACCLLAAGPPTAPAAPLPAALSLKHIFAVPYVVLCGRLYKVHEEDGKPFELEMSWICEESGFKHQRVGGVSTDKPLATD